MGTYAHSDDSTHGSMIAQITYKNLKANWWSVRLGPLAPAGQMISESSSCEAGEEFHSLLPVGRWEALAWCTEVRHPGAFVCVCREGRHTQEICLIEMWCCLFWYLICMLDFLAYAIFHQGPPSSLCWSCASLAPCRKGTSSLGLISCSKIFVFSSRW